MCSLSGNGIFVVRGELSTILTALKRTTRWSSNHHTNPNNDEDNLLRSLQNLKEILNGAHDLHQITSIAYLTPFLHVIRSEDTTGPVTSVALLALNKFLSYGLISDMVPLTVYSISDAVTHARFVGTDQSSDGVVLMRILQVLRTLVLAPEGVYLTNDSICEIMLSCFRICFETRLNELLRRTAEHYLRDMVQLIFLRLHQFSDDQNDQQSLNNIKQFKMRPNTLETTSKHQHSDSVIEVSDSDGDFINKRGIRFTTTNLDVEEDHTKPKLVLIPYDFACVKELFHFLISLCNPFDKQNTDLMIHSGLNLLTVAFEVAGDCIGRFNSLLEMVKDDLCRHLLSLLNTERLPVFSVDLQVCFLVFQSQRTHLKYQLELFLCRLMDIISVDSGKVTQEHKEIALDYLVQLWRLPDSDFPLELYVNYDCNLYCANLYEDLTKLLAKNGFSTTVPFTLDALLSVVERIFQHCSTTGTSPSDNCWLEHKQLLMRKKELKKWLPTGTEHFNHKPKKGIQFFQEHGILYAELDPGQVAQFLRENIHLDKKMIGEYISNRSNLHILDAFVKTFDFTNTRIDEALRLYLETFRLPGEAPTISLLMEHFAEHWHRSNGEPFADVDAAFTLAYAVIMLNVDQHNQNAKKQTIPMSTNSFKKNLQGVNGGQDFNDEMLDDIYNAIKNKEIIMPAEQSGLVRENYLWKVLLRKGTTDEGLYTQFNSCVFDLELFQVIWSPIIAALSFVFDKTDDEQIQTKILKGCECSIYIAAHYQQYKYVDQLVHTICRFTQLYGYGNNIVIGTNLKARAALKVLFNWCHILGDSIREGWRHIFDLYLPLFVHNLLPKIYIEGEEFCENGTRKLLLTYEEPESVVKSDNSSLLSSLYSYMVSSEKLTPTAEEQHQFDTAQQAIQEAHLDQLLIDSKFYHEDSLKYLIRSLIEIGKPPEVPKSQHYNESVTSLCLEIIVKITMQNRDRILIIWPEIRDYFNKLLQSAAQLHYRYLLERSTVGLLRIAVRLMRNEDISAIILQALKVFLIVKQTVLVRISKQISWGLFELLKTSAQNIHTKQDWAVVFTLLEQVGAGNRTIVDEGGSITPTSTTGSDQDLDSDNNMKNSSWILVGSGGQQQQETSGLGPHDPVSLQKCCESLAFLVRDVAHITPYNFEECIHCIRIFVEACYGTNTKRRRRRRRKGLATTSPPVSSPDNSDFEDDILPNGYQQVPIQLLDLMHTLHTRTAQIFRWWAEEGGTITTEDASLWVQGWCPLLQGIARLCCDQRKDVRMCAITYLQRALLVPDLQTLNANEWGECFHLVLFPLLTQLLQPFNEYNNNNNVNNFEDQYDVSKRTVSMTEETRIRAATVLSKVFLHHLTPLQSLPTFTNLWLMILDFLDKYMHADNSDLLYEAIPESLKNILLVMNSANVFQDRNSHLWMVTWERIDKFLPQLKNDLFKDETMVQSVSDENQKVMPVHVSAQLFAHLGQMVSTPILANANTELIHNPDTEIIPQIKSTEV